MTNLEPLGDFALARQYVIYEGHSTIRIPKTVTRMGKYVFEDWMPSQRISVFFAEGDLPSGWAPE